MGTVLEITLVASDEAKARAAIERCFAETERLEMIFTTWREDGELARLNAKAGQGPQRASPELVRILGDARRLSRDTGGTFDISVGPIVSLWREAERRDRLPAPAEIEHARRTVGTNAFDLDASASRVELRQGASLDLGGFAKGWTLDRLAELLAGEGVGRALLNFGGSSLLALGFPLDAPSWRVAVDDGPLLALRDRSVSISSALGQGFEIGNAMFGHIVDPRSGLTVDRRQRAIVIAADGATAEAFSKTFVVLDVHESARLFDVALELEASIDASGASFESRGFAHHVASEGRE